jgi:hypothetical protein
MPSIKSIAKRSQLQWTEDRPTAPGFYLWRGADMYKIIVTQIDGELHFNHEKDRSEYESVYPVNGSWFGPIPN